MKEKKINDADANMPDELIKEVKETKIMRTFSNQKKWTIIAVCIAIIIGLYFILPKSNNNSNSKGALLDIVYPKAYAFDDFDAKLAVVHSNPVKEDFLTALNDFSYKTAAQIFAGNNGNINYSPLSLYYALALAASGSKGETADELLFLLGVTDKTVLSEQCGNLYKRLYKDNNIGKLRIDSSLWMDSSITFENDFIKDVAANFYAHSFSVDFSAAKTAESMAEWISNNTNSTLKPKIEINPEQILSILNTVYFYDEWSDKFDEEKTAEDAFYLSDSTVVKCTFMNSAYSSHVFAKGDGYTRSALRLKNSGNMFFILPDEGVSVYELLSDPERIQDIFWGGEINNGEVIWQIPKFKFSSALDLAESLKSLGINSAFESDADFSGITNHMAFISDIRQETYISIDENGVEASAFTQIYYAGSAPPEGRADMILNRPFIYGIATSDLTLLFIGICENPNAD